eukprot:47190-Amorphochlora_amoeboformis.AAC.1
MVACFVTDKRAKVENIYNYNGARTWETDRIVKPKSNDEKEKKTSRTRRRVLSLNTSAPSAVIDYAPPNSPTSPKFQIIP